jgi:hypothetical protein
MGGFLHDPAHAAVLFRREMLRHCDRRRFRLIDFPA